MSSADVEVVATERSWIVRRGAQRFPTSEHATRGSAVVAARRLAHASRSTLTIHEIDGTVHTEDFTEDWATTTR